MKRIKLYLLIFLSAVSLESFAQQVNININSVPAAVEKGKKGYIEVTICNLDVSPVTAPANKLRPLISVPGNVTITGVTDANGNELTGFNILALTSGNGNSIRLLATEPLPNRECFEFRVIIEGVNIGATDVITGILAFQGPPPVNDNPADNNSTTGIEVITPLPVTLVSFTSTKENQTSLLNWATTQETNSDRFEIERSGNGRFWARIGKVNSHGESTTLKNYWFVDSEPLKGENLYRLRMVDKDETFAYSRIRSVHFESAAEDSSVYPNPSADLVYIRDAKNVEHVVVTDLKGNTVYQSGDLEKGEINVRNLLAGQYAVKVVRKNGSITVQKIVVVK